MLPAGRSAQRVQRRHPRQRRRQLPVRRDRAVGLFARHLPARRGARCAFSCLTHSAQCCVASSTGSKAAGQRRGAHSSTTRSSELHVTNVHSTGRHGEPQSQPRVPRPAMNASQLVMLFFRSRSGPAACNERVSHTVCCRPPALPGNLHCPAGASSSRSACGSMTHAHATSCRARTVWVPVDARGYRWRCLQGAPVCTRLAPWRAVRRARLAIAFERQ